MRRVKWEHFLMSRLQWPGFKLPAGTKATGMTLAAIVALAALPALADVKSGVDAWNQADYMRAVAEWQPLANAGDPDAQFNMAQAYKLGRGVPVDMPKALALFKKAADQGHLRAEDNYGLLLFQQGQRADAMPFIQRAAARGEPRAQYILGTAHFNGEFVGKDWIRAYALMTRAAAAGLPQATESLGQMDKFIPSDQRQRGLALATEMTKEQERQLAAATSVPASTPGRTTAAPPRPSSAPLRTAELPPSTIGAQNYDLPPSGSATGTTYAPPPPAPKPAPVKPAPVKPVPAPPRPAPVKPAVAAPRPATGGAWRVQLGAFSEDGRARALWSSLSGRVSGLSAYQPFLVKGGNVTRLQAGPIASEAEAARLCRAIKAAGADCMPKKT